MKNYRMIVLLVLIAVLASMAGCSPAPTPAAPVAPADTAAPADPAAPAATAPPSVAPTAVPAEPQTLVIGMNLDDMITLDPAIAGETTNIFLFNNIYDELVEIPAEDLGTVQPKLAESFEVSPDGITYTFKLRPGVKFASGNPLTAEDVRWTWTRTKNMKAAASFNVDLVDTIEVVDELTVKVTLLEPSVAFAAIAANPSMGIMDSKLAQENGATDAADADATDTAKEWLDQNSVGTAAYMLESWTPKAEVVLAANPNYWGEKPFFSKVIFRHTADPTTALQMLQKGDVDLTFALDADLVDVAKADSNLVVEINQSLDMNYLAMTSSPELSEPLSNNLVRQAIVYAIDYDGLINALLSGYATRAPTIIPLGVQGVDPAMVFGQDQEKSKALLVEAGYPDGFEVDLNYGSNPTRETVAAKLKSDLAEVGITVNLIPMEQSVYLTEMRAQRLAFTFGGWTPDYLDVTMWTDYYTSVDQGIAFRMLYDNPQAAEVADKIKVELDPNTRVQLVEEVTDILLEDMPFTMLYQLQTIAAMSKDLKGFVYHPVTVVNLYELSK